MAPPSVNPKFANYVCMDDLKDRPWARPYDINGDGNFGVDDLKALISAPKDFSLDGGKASLEISCLQAKIRFVGEEVEWKLKGLLAQPSQEGSHSTSLFNEVDNLERDALARVKDLSSGHEDLAQAAKVRSSIVEVTLRAHNIIREEKTDEPFGIGVGFIPESVSSGGWQEKIVDIYPAGAAAAAGILAGDLLVAVDGRSVQSWSTDGTPAGLVDPETQLMRGLSGARNSEVKVTIQRGTAKFDKVIKRNIWSSRHLGTPDAKTPWDGQEHPEPSLFPAEKMNPSSQPKEEPSSIGCSFNPGARP